MKRRALRWVALGVVVVGVSVAIGMRVTRPTDVVVMPVVRGRAVDAIYATGTVEADRRVTVKAKVAGPVGELPVREGASVKSGDLLARVDDPKAAYDLRRGQVEASAASAQSGRDAPRLAALRARMAAVDAQLAAARRELGRVQGLVASGSLPSTEADRANDRVTELDAQLAGLRADLSAETIDLEASANKTRVAASALAARVSDTEVRSPQAGTVLARYVEPGEVVAVNQPLFKVGDTTNLLLEVSIDEADVAKVHDGTDGKPASRVAASLHAFSGRAFGGSVVMILPDADREKKSYLAKVKLDEPPPGWRSGMTAEVNVIVTARDDVLLAPADAVKDGQVWRVADGRAERRPVKIGIHDLLRVEITDGLAEGDTVAISGTDPLSRDGARVRATTQRPDPLATPPGSAR